MDPLPLDRSAQAPSTSTAVREVLRTRARSQSVVHIRVLEPCPHGGDRVVTACLCLSSWLGQPD